MSGESERGLVITDRQLCALRLLARGDCWIEGHASGGNVVHHATFEVLERHGLAESYEVGRISPDWKGRITDLGRSALANANAARHGAPPVESSEGSGKPT